MKSAPWAYLFVYADDFGSDERVERFIDKSPYIINWQKSLPNSFFIVSEYSAKTLAEHIKKKFGEKRFIVVDTQYDRNGWLPKSAWALMSNPTPAKRKECPHCGENNAKDARFCTNCGHQLD